MPHSNQTRPLAEWMVTEHCSPTGTDLLCVNCGWQGHAELPEAPWPVFQTHTCPPVLVVADNNFSH